MSAATTTTSWELTYLLANGAPDTTEFWDVAWDIFTTSATTQVITGVGGSSGTRASSYSFSTVSSSYSEKNQTFDQIFLYTSSSGDGSQKTATYDTTETTTTSSTSSGDTTVYVNFSFDDGFGDVTNGGTTYSGNGGIYTSSSHSGTFYDAAYDFTVTTSATYAFPLASNGITSLFAWSWQDDAGDSPYSDAFIVTFGTGGGAYSYLNTTTVATTGSYSYQAEFQQISYTGGFVQIQDGVITTLDYDSIQSSCVETTSSSSSVSTWTYIDSPSLLDYGNGSGNSSESFSTQWADELKAPSIGSGAGFSGTTWPNALVYELSYSFGTDLNSYYPETSSVHPNIVSPVEYHTFNNHGALRYYNPEFSSIVYVDASNGTSGQPVYLEGSALSSTYCNFNGGTWLQVLSDLQWQGYPGPYVVRNHTSLVTLGGGQNWSISWDFGMYCWTINFSNGQSSSSSTEYISSLDYGTDISSSSYESQVWDWDEDFTYYAGNVDGTISSPRWTTTTYEADTTFLTTTYGSVVETIGEASTEISVPEGGNLVFQVLPVFDNVFATTSEYFSWLFGTYLY